MFKRCGGLILMVLVLTPVAEAGFGVSVGIVAPLGRPGPFRGPGCRHFHPPCGLPYPIYRPYRPYLPYPVYSPYYYEAVPVPVPVPYYYESPTPPPPTVMESARPAPPTYPPPAPAQTSPPLPILPPPSTEPEPPSVPRVPALPQPIARATHTQTTLVAASGNFETALANVRHPDERIRLDAVPQIARFDSPQAIDALNAVLGRDPIPAVREAAARTLGAMGKAGALMALRNAANGDPDAAVRSSAIESIELIQGVLRRR